MRQRIKRFFRRLYIRFRLWSRKRARAKLEEFFENEHQKEAYTQLEKMIRLPDSELENIPGKFTYYVKNVKRDTHIIFNRKFISITSPTHKYDALINDKIFDSIRNKFVDKIIARVDKFKDEVQVKHEVILKALQNSSIDKADKDEDDEPELQNRELF